MPDLSNKLILVTGSTKGIGKAIAEAFVDVKEVAHAVVFLALNGAVNGSAQRVEGGIIRSI